MRLFIVCLLVCLCAPMAAQDADGQAKRIVERPEYKGYRVERSPGMGGSDGGQDSGQDGSAGQDGGGDGSASRRGTGSSGPRRGTDSDGPSRGSGGGGSGGDGLSLPGWIASLFEIVAWIVMIGVAGVALFFIVKAILGIKRSPKQKSDKSKRSKKTVPEGEVAVLDDTEDLEQVFEDALEVALREYKQALATEDYAAATLLAYRIFWLRAGWRGCVENADVRTWRDALRMVRAAERRQEVRALLPMVERVRYADYVPNKGEFNSWSLSLERIEPSRVLK